MLVWKKFARWKRCLQKLRSLFEKPEAPSDVLEGVNITVTQGPGKTYTVKKMKIKKFIEVINRLWYNVKYKHLV